MSKAGLMKVSAERITAEYQAKVMIYLTVCSTYGVDSTEAGEARRKMNRIGDVLIQRLGQ